MMKGRDGMESRDIYITEYDLKRLKELVQVGISFAERDRESLEKLQGEVDRAHIVEPTAVPGDVVTMNSRVRFKDLDTNSGQGLHAGVPVRGEVGATEDFCVGAHRHGYSRLSGRRHGGMAGTRWDQESTD